MMMGDERFPHGRSAQIGVDLRHASVGLRLGLSLCNVHAVCRLRSRTNGQAARSFGECNKHGRGTAFYFADITGNVADGFVHTCTIDLGRRCTNE